MTKEELKQEFDNLVSIRQEHFEQFVKDLLNQLMKCCNLTISDLALLLDTSEHRIEGILSDEWDGRMSTKMLVKISTLGNCFINDLGLELHVDDVNENDMDNFKKAIHEYLHPEPKLTHDDKITLLLTLFGVNDDEESLNRLLETVADVRKTFNMVENEYDKHSDYYNECNSECDEDDKSDDIKKVTIQDDYNDTLENIYNIFNKLFEKTVPILKNMKDQYDKQNYLKD